MTRNDEVFTIGELIESLEKFPKDKPVKIMALGIDGDCDECIIDVISYPLVNYDDEIDENGNPIFTEERDFVGIFTKEYSDFVFMNGI